MKKLFLAAVLLACGFANAGESVISKAKMAKSENLTVSASSKNECDKKLESTISQLKGQFEVISVDECKTDSSYVGKSPQRKSFKAQVNFL